MSEASRRLGRIHVKAGWTKPPTLDDAVKCKGGDRDMDRCCRTDAHRFPSNIVGVHCFCGDQMRVFARRQNLHGVVHDFDPESNS